MGYLRFPTLRGDRLVFVADDDLFEVDAQGGIARRLTAGLGRTVRPYLSPDGKRLAFSATDEGNFEVYTADARGGAARRLTFHGEQALVVGWHDERILYATAVGRPTPKELHLWSVDPHDPVPERLPLGHAHQLAVSSKGWRALGRYTGDLARWKRYRGGRVGQLWVDSGRGFQKLALDGNLTDPAWIGDRLFFLSDAGGTANLWSCSKTGRSLRQHTRHEGFYARHAAADGERVVYVVAGQLWIWSEATGSRKLEIELHSPRTHLQRKFVQAPRYIEGASLHPEGHSLLLTMRGRPLVAGLWDGATVQLGVPQGVRYRLCRFLKDNQVVAVCDEGGEEHLQILSTQRLGEPRRIRADLGRIVRLKVDPTGQRLAFSNHRHEVGLVEVASGLVQILARADAGRIRGMDFSPDGRWLAFSEPTSATRARIRLCEVETLRVVSVTDGSFADTQPCFDVHGRYLYFLSAREFDPVYDSLQFDLNFPRGQAPYLVTLRAAEPNPFQREPRALGAPTKAAPAKRVDIDLDHIAQRILRFPVKESKYHQIRSVSTGVLVSRSTPRGSLEDHWSQDREPRAEASLLLFDFAKRELTPIYRNITSFSTDPAGKTVLYRSGWKFRAVLPKERSDKKAVTRPGRKSGWIDTGRFRVDVDIRAEWDQMLRESWRLMRDHFWKPDMSGIDWNEVYTRYRPLLDRVLTRSEYADLVWCMQGELGTSHAFELGGDYITGPRYRMGQLAIQTRWHPAGAWEITDIVRGEPGRPRASSPLWAAGAGCRVGDRIWAVNGRRASADTPFRSLLVNTADKPVQLWVSAKGSDEVRAVTVRTLTESRSAWYRDWVLNNRARVHAATEGRVGYLHVINMGPRGYAEFHRDFLSEADRSGLIVDVRHNGGGHVSQLLIEKLAQRRLAYVTSRWGTPRAYPYTSPAGPMVALANALTGSDGDVFTHTFKQLGLGPVIGTRTWGGTVGIKPRQRLVDRSLTTQPEFSFWFPDLAHGLENCGTPPTVEVEQSPEDDLHDVQLERAIDEIVSLLEGSEPPEIPDTLGGLP